MQVNLEDTSNILVEKEKNGDGFVIIIDSRTRVRVTKTELKLMHALIGAQLEDNAKAGRDALKKVLADSLTTHKTKFQEVLRRMKQEEIALAVWYAGDLRVTHEVLKHMSKRTADDVQESIRESIERRIRKERSTGNTDYEIQVAESGKIALTNMLKLVLDSETLPI